ncbi:MAG: glycerophosphodiester phosphodiesterase [Acidimicrobiales bacterium]
MVNLGEATVEQLPGLFSPGGGRTPSRGSVKGTGRGSFPAVSVLAHRGSAQSHRENTLEAFGEAARLGADGVELDVRLSADGALVVHHDAVIAGWGQIAELTVAELPEWVPLLGPALDACAPMVVNIEIKNIPGQPGWDPAETAASLVTTLIGERGALTPVVVSSFSLATIDAVQRLDSSIPTGWLTRSAYDQAEALAAVVKRGHVGLHVPGDAVTAELLGRAHDHGVNVCAWTVDDPVRLLEMARCGVDAIITNDVAAAVGVLHPV